MAMLAEPRRKQKWTLNPRGKHWSDDSNKFGQKMLEKMGWSSGKGLGANLNGMTEHIRCKYKNDQAGIGFSHDDRDKQWTQHQEGFNELLQKLQNGETTETPVAEKELSGKSLELKSRQSRARVHYQKFTRGKDVNKYSTKDLANIFGKKNLDPKSQEKEIKLKIEEQLDESPPEPIGSTDSSHGVITIKGGSINDYFKNKMFALGRKVIGEDSNDSESEGERHAGFGFSTAQIKTETPSKSLESHFSFVKSESDTASCNEAKPTPRKRKNEFVFENPALDVDSPRESDITPRKRKSDFVFDNPALELVDSTTGMEHTPKKRRSDFAFENDGFDVEHPQNGESVPASSCSMEVTKKKRKKKVKEPGLDGFINKALNLQSCDDEISSSSQFEIPRPCLGLANNALDLTDETTGRKRVTFNDTLEFDTDVVSGKRKKKKNKNGGKLDKFEVDNEKMKRKKKKARKNEVAGSAFVNEAMDVDVESQEANENAANERKSERAKRKRDRRMSNLETIAEAPDEEKESVIEVVTLDESLVGEASEDFEVLSLETPKKKRKRKNREDKIFGENQQNEAVSTSLDISDEGFELVEVISNFDLDSSFAKSKKSSEPQEERNAKGIERKKKVPAAREPEEMDLTEDRVETVKKIKKAKTKEAVTEHSSENIDMENVEQVESATKKKKQKKVKTEREEKNGVEQTVEESEKKFIAVSEDSKENMDTENVVAKIENVLEVGNVIRMEEVEKVESTKKKKQKKVKEECEEENGVEQAVEGSEKKSIEEKHLNSVAQSLGDPKVKRTKKSFKALFARTPIVNFVGSNINEIKGYGMDFK